MFSVVLFVLLCHWFSGIDRVETAVGEKKRTYTSRAEGAIRGHYLYLSQTSYLSATPPFFSVTTNNELHCKCTCSKTRQCLAATFRSSDRTCALYANDPCDSRTWQNNPDMNFYIHVKRLKYRIYDKPEKNQRLKRLSASHLCASMTNVDPERRWLFVMKISGRATEHFLGLNFDQAPNRVAPSPWSTDPKEQIWNSILMHQWNAHLYFPKYFGFALIHNGTVKEFVYFRLHKTTISNFFNKQHTPVTFCWNLKQQSAQLHHIYDHQGEFKRLFSISSNGNQSFTKPCETHQTFMYISPIGHRDRCLNKGNPSSTVRILFADRCQPLNYDQLTRADALIGLISGETNSNV